MDSGGLGSTSPALPAHQVPSVAVRPQQHRGTQAGRPKNISRVVNLRLRLSLYLGKPVQFPAFSFVVERLP